jgi:hypothetical protein
MMCRSFHGVLCEAAKEVTTPMKQAPSKALTKTPPPPPFLCHSCTFDSKRIAYWTVILLRSGEHQESVWSFFIFDVGRLNNFLYKCSPMTFRTYSVFLLQCSSARQLARDVPADARFICDKAAVLGDRIRKALYLRVETRWKCFVYRRCQLIRFYSVCGGSVKYEYGALVG